MIKLVAKRYLKPGVLAEYTEAVKELVDTTRAEDGCIDYGMFYNEEENAAYMMETWESREALAVHSERLKAEGWGDKLNAYKDPAKDNRLEIVDLVY